MKILYLINFAGKAGTEKYVENLVRIFGAAGHECHFAYNIPGELSEKMKAANIPSIRLNTGRSGFLSASKALADYCRTNKIDVIHAQYPRENIIALMARSRYKSVKVVYTNHLTIHVGTKWKILNRIFTPKNHRIIAVCHEGRDIMVSNCVPADKISVIYNGVEPDPNPESDRTVLKELGIPEESFVLCILARYAPEKGLNFLLDSMKVLQSLTKKAFHLVICGDGELFESVKAKRDELGLTETVIMTGYRTDVPRILSASDLYLNSSECNEALSFAILEAMNAGKPLVVTDVGGNRDLAENEIVCGEVVNYGDTTGFATAILRFIDDPDYLEKMGVAASEKISKRFDLNTLARDVFETYK